MFHQRIQVPTSGGASIAMDAYIPAASREISPDIKRPSILICPGGAFLYLSEREAEPIALRFLAEGFNVFVVWYRVHPSNLPMSTDYAYMDWVQAPKDHRFPMSQQDVAACMAYVRVHADEWHADPDQIALMGFSAGGYLCATMGGLWHRAELWKEMGLTPQEVRPNAVVLAYPPTDTALGSALFFEWATGEKDPEKQKAYSVLNMVTADYPPAFIWHTFPDELVPVQHSIRLAQALAENGVLTELHIFPVGGHGLALSNALTGTIQPECEQWTTLAARFLRDAMNK